MSTLSAEHAADTTVDSAADTHRQRRVPPWLRYILVRLVALPFVAVLLASVAFALVNLVPSDPARAIAGPSSSPAQLAIINHDLGLDKPLPQRYVDYLVRLGHGDLGRSYFTKRPVLTEFRERAVSSLVLIVPSLVLAWVLGVALGALAAYFEGRKVDRTARLLIGVLQSIPDFLIGVVLIFVVYFLLHAAPAPIGQLDLNVLPPPSVTGSALVDGLLAGQVDVVGNALAHLMLPVITLALALAATFAKNTRAQMSDALTGSATEFQRACGLRTVTVLRSSLKLSRTPLITYAGVLFATLLGASAIVETLFDWNGLGQWALTSITKLDVPVIQGFVLLVGLATLIIYLILEVVVTALDPRLSLNQRN